MEPTSLPLLLGLAALLPLASFFLLLAWGPRLGPGGAHGGTLATGAITASAVLSFVSLLIWLGHHPPAPAAQHGDAAGEAHAAADPHHAGESPSPSAASDPHPPAPRAYAGEYYTLGVFGRLRLSISYYIDALTVCMFCLVSLIATCIHIYAMGYMHEELHRVTDREVTGGDGEHLVRPGRYPRFFQYMSLFCFSMLGLVLAGNIAMVFVFWELVGICSYFLIGFYIERPSACRAANKAFIVNRIGDFGMIVGLMVLWTGLGTFSFADVEVTEADGVTRTEPGIFRLVRGEEGGAIRVPDGLVVLGARREVERELRQLPPTATREDAQRAIAARLPQWRDVGRGGSGRGYGYGLLVLAGIGIFCGCVGKSAQFPLHVWLPDAMEGPTPVSALVHSATMVAAGVYLVGRFYPVFAPEVLLVIAVVGGITLLLAASIALTATDIKRVLAYSTVSQLGYMMLALGLGGWLAGLMHLFTHAFFKSLLFLGSGSVIHAVHTNEMTAMGGLRRKMPVTAYTMLVGCLAIAGISVPFLIGFSGYYSKDRILEQAFVFRNVNASWLADALFYAAAGGAGMTAFYMFRMWYMTFAGKPRDEHRYEHAHESPRLMTVPLLVLAVFATGVAWQLPAGWGPLSEIHLVSLLEQARPDGAGGETPAPQLALTWPNEHFAHEPAQHGSVVVPVTVLATLTAWAGIALATVIYLTGSISPAEVRKQFEPIYRLLVHKWWFDELYDLAFVRPTQRLAGWFAALDRRWIDGFIDGLARATRSFATAWDRLADRALVDGTIDAAARGMYRVGLGLRVVQTGHLRQYALFLVVGLIAVFVLISFFWSPSLAR